MVAAVIGNPAPTFKKQAVVDGVFEEVSLEQYKGKWVVLAFVPMAFTFVCPTEIIAYDKKLKEFEQRGAVVLYASTDSEYTLNAWNNAATSDGGLGGVTLPLVSDANHSLSRDYGVLIEDAGIALRGTFIIDPQGVLQQSTINNAPVGRNVDETLRLLDAFQFVAENGEVCPAGWQKGDEAIDTKNASKYFSKH
ncbi:peroxiredoxin [Macrococcus caseolyticus]|nr:peroxiredoxin [Macrococcus caseolyticus]RKO12023.1 peroxiredoxin [Macrococcus caseolyticus]